MYSYKEKGKSLTCLVKRENRVCMFSFLHSCDIFSDNSETVGENRRENENV